MLEGSHLKIYKLITSLLIIGDPISANKKEEVNVKVGSNYPGNST